MTGAWGASRPESVEGVLRDRCAELGLPAWRCDRSGVILEEPREGGLVGMWLRSGEMGRRVAQAAKRCADNASPEPAEIIPGCWVVPLFEHRRRVRTGVTLAMVLSRGALESEDFLVSCEAANLDPAAVRQTLTGMAVFSRETASKLATVLGWTLDDRLNLSQSEQTVDEFTRQLTDSYETIDLLYTLGRCMHDLTRPDNFVWLVCNRLHSTMSFAWIAVRFVESERLASVMNDRLFVTGRAPLAEGVIEPCLDGLMSRFEQEPKSFIAGGGNEVPLSMGAQTIVQPIAREGRLLGALFAGGKTGDDPHVSSYDLQLLETSAGYVGAFLDNVLHYADQQAMFLGSLRALTAAIDAKDRYTRGHSERVAMLGQQLALAAGYEPERAERVHIAGLVHDVGKIGVPEAVLCKPGRLTDEEFELVKLHPEIGYGIVKDIPQLADVLPGVLHHHERWDGRGYPHGLRELEIPEMGRLLALADTFDAMSSTRSYRAAMSRPDVLAEIERCAGCQFDADLAKLFVTLDFAAYDDLVARHAQSQGLEAMPRAA